MYNVLIVDDSSVERKGISMLLDRRNMGFKLFEACNGEEALQLIQNYSIDIVFTDVRMPIMDGIELLKKVKAYNKDIQTIIFSAYGDFEYTSKAIENKANHYILKPINVEQFNKVLDATLKELNSIANNRVQENKVIENLVSFDESFEGDNVTDRIFEAIAQKKLDNLDELVVELFECIKKNNVMSVIFVKQLITEIFKKLYKLVDDEYRGEIYQTVNHIIMMQKMEDLEAGVPELICEVYQKINGVRDSKQISAAVKKGLNRIYQNYAEDISLDTVAAEVNLTPKYFSRIFKQEVGTGFVKCLTNYRLGQAENLLKKTNKNVTEICKAVGIPNSSYFCLIFKRKYGVSPEQYRREELGE